MLRLQIRFNHTKRLWRFYFPGIVWVILGLMLAAGVGSHGRGWVLLSGTMGFTWLLCIGAYYFSYFAYYSKLADAYNEHREYYLSVFRPGWLAVFSLLFLAMLAHTGLVLNDLVSMFEIGKNVGNEHGSITYLNILFMMLDTTVDGITLGFIGSFGLSFSDIAPSALLGRIFVYIVNVVLGYTIIAVGQQTFFAKLAAKHKVSRGGRGKKVDLNYFANPDPTIIHEVWEQYERKRLVPKVHGKQLVQMLRESRSKRSRDIILDVLQSTDDLDVFSACVDYFQSNRDRRFFRLCSNEKDQRKLQILKEKGVPLHQSRRRQAPRKPRS